MFDVSRYVAPSATGVVFLLAASVGLAAVRYAVLPAWVGAVSLLIGALFAVLIARSCSAPASFSPEATAALSDWRDGKFEPAGATLRGAYVVAGSTPACAEDPAGFIAD